MDNDPQYKTGDGSALRIWKDSAQNRYLSEAHGRPIFDEVIFVEVISPGSQGSTPVFELKRTFAEEMNHPEPLLGAKYEEYKTFVENFEQGEKEDASLSGTPLKEWGEISRTMAASLKASNIFSVEALANLPDEKLSVVGPDGRTWREKAAAWLATTKDASVATKYAAENEALRTELAATKDQMAALNAKVEELLAANAGAKTPQAETQAEPVVVEPPAKGAAKADKTVAAPATLKDIV